MSNSKEFKDLDQRIQSKTSIEPTKKHFEVINVSRGEPYRFKSDTPTLTKKPSFLKYKNWLLENSKSKNKKNTIALMALGALFVVALYFIWAIISIILYQ